jgi:RNA polymerase sigma-70 factor (ECF subfamily)
MNTEQSTSAEVESVVESVRLGDQDALQSLLAGHRAYLRQVIDLRMDDALRLRVDPSDIVQEAQLEAVRRVSDYARDPQIPLRLWMRRIAIDRLNMAHRRHVAAEKRSVRRQFALPEQSSMSIAAQLVAGIASPSMEAARGEVTLKVRDAVAKLEDVDQEIILLQAFEGLNSTESAQVLGIEPATARKRFGRALLRLRKLLIDGGLGESEA